MDCSTVWGSTRRASFSVDGQPITDQQSKIFSNQIPLDSIQSMEVIAGAPPAEYGDKTSVVINVTTRSGQGVTTPHGTVTTSYGSFGTSTAAARSLVRRPELGQLHLGQRSEQRTIPRSARVRRAARQGQRRESVRPRGLPDYSCGFDPFELRLHALMVPDAEYLRFPECDRHGMVS